MSSEFRTAAEALGATSDEIAGLVDQPAITPEAALRQLGGRSAEDQRRARFLAGEWRWRALKRFHTKAGRGRLVRLLEGRLDGTETHLPAGLSEEVETAIEADQTHEAHAPQILGLDHARRTYEALVELYATREKP